jgi:hypothetical protein
MITKCCEVCDKKIVIFKEDYTYPEFHIGVFNGENRLYFCSWNCIEEFIKEEN